MKSQRLMIQDGFYSGTEGLRSHIEEVLGQPRGQDPRRFCWDYWHVPGQYRLLRTPAYHFFPKKLYEPLHQKLVHWGRRVLGCHDISPPWLSSYIDGCEQNFHADLPHGPWAFVFSLSPFKKGQKQRPFRGGETMLLKEEVLSFWEQQEFGDSTGLEEQHVLDLVEPYRNRLVVFDPRIPHGVRRVEGALDPLAGRMVVHGWFVHPRPFIEGPLKERELTLAIERVLHAIDGVLQSTRWSGVRVRGMASLSFGIGPRGEVRALKTLAQSLRVPAVAEGLPEVLLKVVGAELKKHAFSKSAKGSRVTLPLVFE